MTLTLLLDLDDTLLENPVSSFLSAYLTALSDQLSSYADPQQVISSLLAGTRQMIDNQRPDYTLKDVFDTTFYPSLGLVENDLLDALDHFYKQVYPGLKKYTNKKPDAIHFVEESIKHGHQVAIATNPLFPYTAIIQRLEWAGLSPENYPFAIIPSYETFHFTKPNPAYLAEVLALLGWPENAAVMIGDSYENDVACANSLGIPSYLISDNHHPINNETSNQAESGDFSRLQEWLLQNDGHFEMDFHKPTALLAILRATPAALNSLCNQLHIDAWTARPKPEEWCQTEVLCHLRDVEVEVNLPRLTELIQNTDPFLPGFDSDSWAEERGYVDQDGPLALQGFITSRIQTLQLLDGLSPEDWERPARHAIFGPTSLSELVSIMAGHDQLHIRQLYQLVNNQP